MDGRGVPLSIDVTGANCHDVKRLAVLVYGIVISRPEERHNLCLDNGYDGKNSLRIIEEANYTACIQGRGADKRKLAALPGYKARRWVVEAAHSWMNRFRKLLVRYEKKASSYIALLHMAAAIIAFRKAGFIYE